MTPADTRRFLAAAGLLATLDGATTAEPVTPPGVAPPPVLDMPVVPAAAPLPPLPVIQLPPADPKPIDAPKPIPLPTVSQPAGPVEVLPPPLVEKKADDKSAPPPVLDPPKFDPPKLEPLPFQPPKLDIPTPNRPMTDGPKPADPPPLPSPFAPAQPAPPAKSDAPSAPAGSPQADFNLQPAGPRLNVKPESAEPARPVPAVPTSVSRPPEPEPPSGDAPVLPVRKLTMSAVLGTALAVTPVVAQDGANKKDDTSKVAAPTAEDMTALRNEVKQLREMLQGKTESGITKVGLAERVEKLERKLDTLDETLKRIEGKLDTARTAGSSPVGGGATTTAGNGTVTVVNEYPVEVSIVINGVSRRLDPSQKKEFTVPAGTFKYWLLGGSGEEKARAIKENENVSLWIR